MAQLLTHVFKRWNDRQEESIADLETRDSIGGIGEESELELETK